MNIHPLNTPNKLPAYTLPSITPIRPPSPLSREPGTLANAIVALAGCELIVRNPNPSPESPMLKLVKDALAKIGMESPHLAMLPLDAVSTGNTNRDANMYFCYIQLSPNIAALD